MLVMQLSLVIVDQKDIIWKAVSDEGHGLFCCCHRDRYVAGLIFLRSKVLFFI